MAEWKYLVMTGQELSIMALLTEDNSPISRITSALDQMGKQGWELVAPGELDSKSVHSCFYFKRHA